MNICA